MISLLGLLYACNSEKNEQLSSSQIEETEKQIQEAADSIVSMFDEANSTNDKYYEGLKTYEENGKYGFVDSLGNIVIKPQFDHVGCFNEGLVSVEINNKYGFIDHNGKVVIPLEYEYANYFNQGVADVQKNGKMGFINKKGKVILPFEYDRVISFWEPDGFAAVSKNNLWGLIDINGNIVVPIQYENAFSSRRGKAAVYSSGKKYEVYNDGRVIEIQF